MYICYLQYSSVPILELVFRLFKCAEIQTERVKGASRGSFFSPAQGSREGLGGFW